MSIFKSKWAAVFFMALLLPCHGFAAEATRSISVDGDIFVDQSGRHVLLRGVNAGGRSKFPPYLPFDPRPFQTTLELYADNIKAHGFNVVRLLVIYEAAEPERGIYNEEYLARYDAMVKAFASRGIYIIIDGHQDLFSRRFKGDGFPDWAIPEKYRGLDQTNDRSLWSLGYFTLPVLQSLQRFWSNEDGIQDSHVSFYKMLAQRYRHEPYVIGFEPINEPMPGWKGYLDYAGFHRDLYAYYERVAYAVQSVDKNYLLFADICALENTGTINTRKPRPKVNNLVLAPHYYDPGTFGFSISKEFDNKIMVKGIGRHMKLARHWKVPVIFTEYGISPVDESAPDYINRLYSIFDKNLISGTFWEASISKETWNFENTSIFDEHGNTRKNAFAVDRPYPRSVNGKIIKYRYNPDIKEIFLEWTEAPSVKADTEIYLPVHIYGTDPKVVLKSGESDWRMDQPKRLLVITPLETKGANRQVVISP